VHRQIKPPPSKPLISKNLLLGLLGFVVLGGIGVYVYRRRDDFQLPKRREKLPPVPKSRALPEGYSKPEHEYGLGPRPYAPYPHGGAYELDIGPSFPEHG
jgi:LPXTG-motif cell wall-anchored protein